MDYQRIYREFIRDRMGKPEILGYAEVHHILPRSLGGGNDPSNLIRLTPEDHFFAHLLLAKAHNTWELWAAICLMTGRHGDGESAFPRIRRLYGSARRGLSKVHPLVDATVRHWKHKGGGEFVGATAELAQSVGRPRGGFHLVVAGTTRSNAGWYLADQYESFPAPRKKSVSLEHVALKHADGRNFSGSRLSVQKQAGLRSSDMTALRRGRLLNVKGWMLPETDPASVRLVPAKGGTG